MESLTGYEPRTYRDFDESDGFKTFRVVVETSDLYIKALCSLEKETEALIKKYRAQIKWAIARRPEFLSSLKPLEEDPADSPIVASMIRAGKKAGTGPMAAVAGAVAEFVGKELLQWSPEVIIENGGDIFLKVARPILVGVFAGNSQFSGRFGIQVQPTVLPIGICTSSGRVGPSLSLGVSDAATIISKDTALADAAATAMGNRIRSGRDLKAAVEWAMTIPGVEGALAALDDKMAVLGDLELAPLRP
jgi:ApbE superfamily uncharacterized protein (UPF0280 family)